MIKVEHIEVFNFKGAIRGLRNPMNSWAKSDSRYATALDEATIANVKKGEFILGENDLDLMRRLYNAGSEHRKYLRQIFVSFYITAPTYWYAEFDTYKVGVTRNSCSFMHKGVSKPFGISDFSVSDDRIYDILLPIEKKTYELVYPYETDEYKEYICENGRKYKVYRNGKIVSKKYEYIDSMNRHRTFEEKECIPSKTSNGYFELNIGGRNGEKWLLHRLIATVWLDNKNNLSTVNHIDGNKGNNCIENLEWCDLKENIQKGFNSGLFENGKSLHTDYIKWKNGHTLVDPYIKSQILNDYRNNNLTYKEIAKKYNITEKQSNNICCYKETENTSLFMLCYSWENIINELNRLRDEYLETKDDKIFQQIRCLLPSGYNQKSTITMNYENVVTMIKQRKGHRLQEWNEFVEILKNLPYISEIMA